MNDNLNKKCSVNYFHKTIQLPSIKSADSVGLDNFVQHYFVSPFYKTRNLMPFITLARAIILLRVSLALVFIIHATVRILHHTIGNFSEFLTNKGFKYATVIVWMITVFEIVGGVILAIGNYVKQLSIGFIIILLIGIILIHLPLGWFVGEHGTGGVEYSFILIMAFIAVMAAEK
jgi:putative oxidoreductase